MNEPIDVAIAGGGIGGLTLAIALARRGITARVFERAERLEPVGAGITMQVNAMRVFERLGLANAVTAAGRVLAVGALRTPNGKVLRSLQLLDDSSSDRSVAIHRARLHEVLVAALPPETLVTGTAIAGVAIEGDGATLEHADGTRTAARIVVGADGIHSAIRTALHGEQPLRDSGQIAWRGIAPHAFADDEPSGETWGRRARFGIVPISATDTYWFAVLDAADSPPETADQRAALRELFASWHEPIPALLDTEGPVIRTPILDRPPIDEWGNGSVTLLGDAAHPMTPNLGQGGCQAIEDAWVLAAALGKGLDATALRRYERARNQRARRFVDESWKFGKLAQTPSGIVRALRNTAMRVLPQRMLDSRIAWTRDFDPDQLANQVDETAKLDERP